MRHLVIKNFGPIRNADLQLGQVKCIDRYAEFRQELRT